MTHRHPYPGQNKSLADRFEAKVEYEPNTGCWLWSGAVNNRGYGQIGRDGKIVLAHRVSLEIHSGSVAANDHVLHRCDTPPCVNPDHLFRGDHRANMDDMIAKGRKVQLRGDETPAAKLSTQTVLGILAAFKRGESVRAVARRLGIAQGTVANISAGRTWAHLREAA